jgi:hypothetical protein
MHLGIAPCASVNPSDPAVEEALLRVVGNAALCRQVTA